MERPQHIVEVDPNGVTDRETLQLVNDFACVYRSMFQGATLGPWLENRVQLLIEGWLPGWCLSLAQIVDPQRPDLQSRSWDIVVHKPVPSEMDFPPPSRPYRGYPLLPKYLCCAAIDTKSRYNQPRDYARLPAFNITNDAIVPQLALLAPTIAPILFIFASTYEEEAVKAAAWESGMSAFVLVKAHDFGLTHGAGRYGWRLNGGNRSQPPLQEFKGLLKESAGRWEDPFRGLETAP